MQPPYLGVSFFTQNCGLPVGFPSKHKKGGHPQKEIHPFGPNIHHRQNKNKKTFAWSQESRSARSGSEEGDCGMCFPSERGSAQIGVWPLLITLGRPSPLLFVLLLGGKPLGASREMIRTGLHFWLEGGCLMLMALCSPSAPSRDSWDQRAAREAKRCFASC